ncbi:lipoprotein [Paenibacillus sp. LHD-117]|uniref:LptM family lipoprotein n=1 Tax=Paenibacillus sp. LHD-117 TaxID=3071412 RepID=UPI0027E042B0|nr:lipoprotein [Paenibacillus sp. LHD-117]MDQ6420198.1 lipoprotein [Paenibacillus sp. LHD-117]
MKKVLIMAIVLLFGLAGCGNKGENEIVSIRIECAEICKSMGSPPFTEKTFKAINEIKAFQRAIEKAEKMDGVLNYGVMFYMTVSYQDDTKQKYVLNVSDEEGSRGLLVDAANSSQGYEIPEEQAEELARLIYA